MKIKIINRLYSLIPVFLLTLPMLFPMQLIAEELLIPRPEGFVTDRAGIIDTRVKTALEGVLRELEASTEAEVAVLTVNSTKPLDIFDYSMKVAEDWKTGKKGKDTGLLIVVAKDDRKMWILTGYGLEGMLPDGKVGEIRDRYFIPYFRRGDYSTGILKGTTILANIIAGEHGVKLSSNQRSQYDPLKRRMRKPSRRRFGLGSIILLLILLGIGFPYLWPLLFLGGIGRRGIMWGGGGLRGGGFGGGFGGFGGGGFGGGGAGGGW